MSTVLPFLKMFYDTTMHISGSSYVTSNIYMKVFAIGRKIRTYCERRGANWVDPNKVNMMLLIAVVRDPRSKLGYPNHYLGYFFEKEKVEALQAKLLSSLKSTYR